MYARLIITSLNAVYYILLLIIFFIFFYFFPPGTFMYTIVFFVHVKFSERVCQITFIRYRAEYTRRLSLHTHTHTHTMRDVCYNNNNMFAFILSRPLPENEILLVTI